MEKQAKRAKTTVEADIFGVEGFDVHFVGGESVNGKYVDPYPYEKAANSAWTVKKWRTSRWEPNYPDFGVEVLAPDGTPVHGKTLLSNLRAMCLDEDEYDEEWIDELEGESFNQPVPPTKDKRGRVEGLSKSSDSAPAQGSSILAGGLRSKVDALWNAFWSGGISNPLEVIEQITYLLFLKRLDDLQTLAENKATQLGQPIENPVFPEGNDDKGGAYADMRWSRLKNMAPAEMFKVMSEHVFPFLRALGGEGSTYATHMQDATFTIPTASLLAKAVDGISDIPMNDLDTKGDTYEYMLAKIAAAGQNGQFRTPRHIISLMVAMREPTPSDTVLDPACGTCGFLVGAAQYIRSHHPEALLDAGLREHFNHGMFYGYDFDNTMLRIGSMNMLLHGVENPDVRYKDSLSQLHAEEEEMYSLVLANPPFAGSLDYENTAKDLLQVVRTKKTELLFLALFLRVLKPGGRAAVIVPDGVLFGSSKAHKELRRILVEDQQLQGVVSLPSGVFRPYAGVSTAILFFTKTNSGGTDDVWFYDLQADGFSLDDKRAALLDGDRLGVAPAVVLAEDEHAKNNLPDVLARWHERDGSERSRARTDQSFCVPRADIVANEYDLSINRYKEVVHEEVEYRAPKDIIADLMVLEDEMRQGLSDLDSMLR